MNPNKTKNFGNFTLGEYVYSNKLIIKFINSNVKKIKIEQIPIKDLMPNLYNKEWEDLNNNFDEFISPHDVLINKSKYSKHWEKIINAELDYPIVITNNYTILDGTHRFTKALLSGKKDINVYIFNSFLLDKFIICSDSNPDKKKIIDEFEKKSDEELDKIYQERFGLFIYSEQIIYFLVFIFMIVLYKIF